jgi:hypothetical protein
LELTVGLRDGITEKLSASHVKRRAPPTREPYHQPDLIVVSEWDGSLLDLIGALLSATNSPIFNCRLIELLV